MNRFTTFIKTKIKWILLLTVIATLSLNFSFKTASTYFEIAKNLDIFASLYREVNAYYVDEVEPSTLMKKGIDAMLMNLDPYTNYISEDDIEDFKFVTTGQYGGVGAIIGQFGDDIVILEPYEGFAAFKAGIKAGDKILSIDGKNTAGKNTSDVSKILKGQPGTIVELKIASSIDDKEKMVKVVREEIKIDNVPFHGMIDNEIGYISLKGFTQKASKEVAEAFIDLKGKGAKKIIFDLRDNPGGLLHEAVNISNIFVPKGEDIVSTKGKVKDWDKVYTAQNSPLDTEIPIITLINRGAASASEIVSGVFQDLDRGVIIGEKSFGKGLVQTTRPLSYKSQLKVTTAKYYTPSGRCIQAVDYSHRNEDGSVGKIPDSLKITFQTRNGRVVYDGGGIEPDVPVSRKSLSNIAASLTQKRHIFNYSVKYRNEHPNIAPPDSFVFEEAEFNKFVAWLGDKEYDYVTKSERALEELKKQSENESYFEDLETDFEQLEQKIKHNKTEDLKRHKEEISDLLRLEIIKHFYFQKGVILASFNHDPFIKGAVDLFADMDKYYAILKGEGVNKSKKK